MNYSYNQYRSTLPVSNESQVPFDQHILPSEDLYPTDPANISLSDDNDADLQAPVTIMNTKGSKASKKVAGRWISEKPNVHALHLLSKPKQKSSQKATVSKHPKNPEIFVIDSNVHEEVQDVHQERWGWPARTGNYNQDNKHKILWLAWVIPPILVGLWWDCLLHNYLFTVHFCSLLIVNWLRGSPVICTSDFTPYRIYFTFLEPNMWAIHPLLLVVK